MVRTRPTKSNLSTCWLWLPTGRKKCLTYNQTCHNCGKIGHFSRVCRQKIPAAGNKGWPRLKQTHNHTKWSATHSALQHEKKIDNSGPNRWPQVMGKPISTSSQSGAVAGPHFVRVLGEHMDNIAHFDVTPRAVNGSTLHPVGKIPNVTLHTHGRTANEDMHIYDSVEGALISWATAQRLGILLSQTSGTSQTRNTRNPRVITVDHIMYVRVSHSIWGPGPHNAWREISHLCNYRYSTILWNYPTYHSLCIQG